MEKFIVATISDANCEQDYLERLATNGVSVMRLNTAHQSFEGSELIINNIRKVSQKIGKKIAIMIDTKGPEIRTVDVEEPLSLNENERVQIALKKEDLTSKGFCVSYDGILKYAKEGDIVLVDDGEVELIVDSVEPKFLWCHAVNSGPIENKKSVNVPGMIVELPALTEKDKEYVRFAVRENADYIAHSFVRSKSDIEEIYKIYKEFNKEVFPKIYAKIENQDGLRNIDEILEIADGILVARGDLANEIPLEDLAFAQKYLVKKANQAGKPVIVATQMAYSMCWHPRPTRAELTDMSNAILDGADAIMLSGETTHGKYGVEAVKLMTKIINRYQNGLETISGTDRNFIYGDTDFRVQA